MVKGRGCVYKGGDTGRICVDIGGLGREDPRRVPHESCVCKLLT